MSERELPDGWADAKVSDFCAILDSRRIPLNADERKNRKGPYPYYGANGQVDSIDDYIFDGEHILLAEDGGFFDQKGRSVAYLADGQFWVNNHAHILKALGTINHALISHWFNTFDWMPYVGGTTRLKLTQGGLRDIHFPIPPLNEQRRIADRIDALQARSRRAREALAEAQTLLEQFRQSILSAAFRGDLTAKWREEHGVKLASWRNTKLDKISKVVRGGSPRPAGDPTFYGGDIPFLKVADITRNDGPYIRSAQYTITEAGLRKTRKVEQNTLLLTNSGATLGVPGICTFETTFNDGIAAFLDLTEDIKYVYYYLLSQIQNFRGVNKGAAQPNLNTDIIGSWLIPVPTLAEQYEIVITIERFFNSEQILKVIQDTSASLHVLDQSILVKAFCGELVPQDPNEEPAAKLLERIQSEKQSSGSVKTTRGKRKSKP